MHSRINLSYVSGSFMEEGRYSSHGTSQKKDYLELSPASNYFLRPPLGNLSHAETNLFYVTLDKNVTISSPHTEIRSVYSFLVNFSTDSADII